MRVKAVALGHRAWDLFSAEYPLAGNTEISRVHVALQQGDKYPRQQLGAPVDRLLVCEAHAKDLEDGS